MASLTATVLAVALLTLPQTNAGFIDTTDNLGNAWASDTLDPPTSLTATGTGLVSLNWTATTDTYATGHRVLRSTSPGGPYSQIAQITPRTTTSYIDAPPVGTYYYVVRAYIGTWESANSNEDSATTVPNSPPTADAGGPYATVEGGILLLDASGSSDPETDPLTYAWDLDNDTFYDDAVGVGPLLTWGALVAVGIDDDGSYPIAVQVDDGLNPPVVDSATLTITNTAPTLTTTGATTSPTGSVYTLTLGASDPGDDTISEWVIDWGDGTIDIIAGNPPTVTHSYAGVGATYNVLAAATDEDGTYRQNDLLVPSYSNDLTIRYKADGTSSTLEAGHGLDQPYDVAIGPGGDFYVTGIGSNEVARYDGTTGTWIGRVVSGVDALGLTFGPDGNLYVASYGTNEVLEYDGTTLAPLGAFVSAGSGGLTEPAGITFGADGNLYVSAFSDSAVNRYDGTTGASMGLFVTTGSNGLATPEDLTFGPDGHLYVTDPSNNNIQRYDGTSGASLGVFNTGLNPSGATGLVFGPDGYLYVASYFDNDIHRFNATTGAYAGDEVTSGAGGLNGPTYLTLVPQQQVTVTANNEDYDAIPAGSDNCPLTFNVDQFDTDGDGTGDACDPSSTVATAGTFIDSGQAMGTTNSNDVEFGDLDGDGDLDMVVTASTSQPTKVWFNDGTGAYADSGQSLGTGAANDVALGDLDGDGDLDAALSIYSGQPNTVWLNDGSGVFADSGQLLGTSHSVSLVLGDVDGDADLDLVFGNNYDSQPDQVWLNDGAGVFTDSGQTLGATNSYGIAIGDLDGDQDLDLVMGNYSSQANTVWFNNGTGTYTDSGQALGNRNTRGATLADVDGDGDLDAAFANQGTQPNTVWINNGSGGFSLAAGTLGTTNARHIAFGDVDGDGDLDAAVINYGVADTLWLNAGNGTFLNSGQVLDTSNGYAAAFGDVDGDQDLDLAIANYGQPNTVWLNAAGPMIGLADSWQPGLSHSAGSGSNRLLVFVASNEQQAASTPTLSGVSYGGQALTQALSAEVTSGFITASVEIWVLNEAGISAAAGTAITPSWTGTPDTPLYSHAVYENVDQATPTGALARGAATGDTPNPVPLSAVATSIGDMVIGAAIAGEVGSYTPQNSFLLGLTQDTTIGGTTTHGTGYKVADGSNETVSMLFNPAVPPWTNRQVVLALVLNAAP